MAGVRVPQPGAVHPVREHRKGQPYAGGDRVTETGLGLGARHYMSPEQATGDPHVGPAIDIHGVSSRPGNPTSQVRGPSASSW
jgi:hypothetical protein